MSAKINDGMTNKQRYILRHKERLLHIWRDEKKRSYWKHREKLLVRGRLWRANNPNLTKAADQRKWERFKQWRLDNPELAKQFDAKHYAKYLPYHQEYNKRNSDARRAGNRDWYQHRMSEQSRAKQSTKRQRRRALLRNVEGQFTAEDVQDKIRIQRHKCYWCKKPHGVVYHIDHAIPLAKGGTNDSGNIVIACAKCNLSKRDKMPSEFAGVLL